MTPQEIIDNNRKIALFMGAEKQGFTRNWKIIEGLKFANSQDNAWVRSSNYAMEDLKFHSSWDWLMPVVGKINGMLDEEYSFLYLITIRPDYCEVFSSDECSEIIRNENGSTMLEMVYLTIIQFIDWYNLQNEISFENYQNLPEKVQEIIESFDEEIDSYQECERLLKELRPHGYTFEYYLDGEPYDLQKLEFTEFHSVGTAIDQMGFGYAMNKNGTVDLNNPVYYTEFDDHWFDCLTNTERQLFIELKQRFEK